jgi:hypothetical protein
LTLPESLIASLELEFDSDMNVEFPDGSSLTAPQFEVVVLDDSQSRTVIALEIGDEVLIGMRFLRDHRVMFDGCPGGTFVMKPLPLPPI